MLNQAKDTDPTAGIVNLTIISLIPPPQVG